jgi:hypothetical protein
LEHLPDLRVLDLSDTAVTDAGLVHVKGLAKLEELELDGTEVTDAGLVHLKGLSNLRKLRLQGTQVTEQGAKKILQALPIEDYYGPEEPEAGGEKTGWGPAVEGVQMRVTEDKFTLAEGGKIDLRVDLRNRGNRDRRIALEHESWELEIDGKWYLPSGGASGFRRELPLATGQTQRNLEVWDWLWENLTTTVQQLPPGKHTLRVARTLPGFGVPRGQSRIRVVSNPVEIEIVPAEGRTGAGTSADVTLSPFTVFSAGGAEEVKAPAVDAGIALDLDSGRTVSVASGPDPGSHQQLGNWLYEHHLEVVVRYERNGYCILGKDVVLKALDADRAKDLTVAELRYALASSGNESERDLEAGILPHGFLQIRLDEKEGLPVTLAFQTAAGNLGLLQIEQPADSPKVLQFRRRMVRIKPGTE